MKSSWAISRRTMLRGLGTSVSLPLLEIMRPLARAQEQENEQVAKPVTRLAYLYIPNGVANGAWFPDSVGDDQQINKLNQWMRSLQPFANEITLFRDLWTPRGNGHGAGTATWLTGGGFDGERIDAGGVSADQIAASHFASRTLLPSLELSMRGEGFFSSNLPRNSISWVNAQTPASRDVEPRVVFDRMFRSGESPLSNPSVLDMVLEDARRIKRRSSQQDRRKVDEYLESVRSIERRIEFAESQRQRASTTPGLRKAMKRPPSDIPDDHGEYVQLMLEMMVLAFWSDASRVATCMMDHGQSNRYFDFIDGVRGTWHALSHWKDISGKTEDDDGMTSWSSRQEKQEMYNRVTAWHTKQLAYLLRRLSEIEEDGSTLLDNSMIVYGSSLGDGHEHEEKNLPLLLAGRGGGTIRPGRVIQRRGEISMSELHLSLLQTLGVPCKRFAECDTPLSLG